MSDDAFIGAILAAILFFFLGIFIGSQVNHYWTTQRWQREAVAAGHAEYVTRDGEPVWQWRNNTKGGEQ